MKFAWTTHRPSTVLQGPLPVQARPFRLAWTRTLSSSALQGPSPVQANFINAIAPHRRPPPRRRGLPPVRPAAPPPASGAPPRAPAATHLHLHPRWSALQGLLPCKCVAATCPRRRSAHSCRYAFAPRPASQRAAGPPPLQMRSRHLPPASLSAALPLRICTPPGLPARCRPSRPANAYPPPAPGVLQRGLAATHLHLYPRWSALQGLHPCKCVAATCPRRPSARPCRYAFAPVPALERAAGPPPLQMRSRHLPPASLSAALPLRICTPPGLPARCRPSRPANAYPPSRPAFPAAARQTQFGWKCVFGGDIRGLETRFGRKCVFCGAGGWGVVGSAEGRATWALFASR